MYARYIKITFKDKLAKEMMITYSNSVADAEGIKNGLLLRFTIDQSELTAILVLVFANYEDFKSFDPAPNFSNSNMYCMSHTTS